MRLTAHPPTTSIPSLFTPLIFLPPFVVVVFIVMCHWSRRLSIHRSKYSKKKTFRTKSAVQLDPNHSVFHIHSSIVLVSLPKLSFTHSCSDYVHEHSQTAIAALSHLILNVKGESMCRVGNCTFSPLTQASSAFSAFSCFACVSVSV